MQGSAKNMNHVLSIYFLFFIGGLSALCEPAKQWTWFHRKTFNVHEQIENKSKKEIACSKVDLPDFTQLVFSWNALRPGKGHFVFYAQVRNAQTKKWSKWHRMITWGATEQKSFKTEADTISSYHHVRLEAPEAKTADAFCIKAEAEQGAQLSLIKSLCINVSNLRVFGAESESNFCLPSVYIKGVPRLSQFELMHPRNDGLCSPTSCTMLMSYLLAKYIDPIDFAEKSFDHGLDKYGSWPFNMAHAYERADGAISCAVLRLNSFKNLYDHLCKKIPVAVSVRGYMKGAPRSYDKGHLLLVVGFDGVKKEVICHDPAVSQSKLAQKRYQLKDFLQAWERSHRLAYIAERLI